MNETRSIPKVSLLHACRLAAVAVSLPLIAGCAFGGHSDDAQGKTPPSAPAATLLPPPPASTVAVAVKSSELRVTGKIQPQVSKEIDVSPRFSGRVMEMLVGLGQQVQKGQVLATVDSHEVGELQAELLEAQSKLDLAGAQEERERQVYEEQLQRPKELLAAQADFEQTKVQLQLAQTDFERADALYKQKIGSAKDYEQAKAVLDRLKARYKECEADYQREQELYANKAVLKRDLQFAHSEKIRCLQHVNTLRQRMIFLGMPAKLVDQVLRTRNVVAATPICSPISGFITDQGVAVGEMVAPEKKVFTVTDLSTVVVRADIPETDAQSVKLGEHVCITMNAYPDEKFHGTISAIGDHVDPETRTFWIRAKIANPDRKLKLNMFVDIVLPRTSSCPKDA